MNCHLLIRNPKQAKGADRGGVGKLIDHNMEVIAGKRAITPGRIQEKHGVAHEEAENELRTREASLR
jgi:uncharacterized protein YjbJ (UPF0337 family)